MSISSVAGATTPISTPSSPWNFRQDFTTMTSALRSGDLSGAQSAYQTLLSDNPAVASQIQSGTSQNPFLQGLASIGTALDNGDLNGATQALHQLWQTEGKLHHGQHRAAPDTSSDSSTPETGSAADPSSLDVTA